MSTFLSGIAVAWIAVILIIMLRGRNAEIALGLSICGCCLIVILLVEFLSPVVAFIRDLEGMIPGESGWILLLIKIVGIGFTGEIASLVCTDSGNSAIGKTLQMLTAGVILYLSLPMLTALLDLVKNMLEKV